MRLLLFIYITVCSYSVAGGANEKIINLDVNTRNGTDEVKVTESDPRKLEGDVNKGVHDKILKIGNTESSSPPEVTTTVGPADSSPPEVHPAVSSSNYLSLKGNATPGDRGEGSEGKTSSGIPVADLREAKGEVNREGTTPSGTLVGTSGGSVDDIDWTSDGDDGCFIYLFNLFDDLGDKYRRVMIIMTIIYDMMFGQVKDSLYKLLFHDTGIIQYNNLLKLEEGNKEMSRGSVESRIIRVMSYNVQAFHKIIFPNINIYNRMDTLLKYTRELIIERGVDVIVFQEVFLYEFYTRLVEELNSILPYNTGVIGQTREIYQWNSYVNERSWLNFSFINGGVCIFSKYPIVEKHQLTFKDYTGRSRFLRKGAALAVIKKNDVMFNIIGTHLQAFDEVEHQNIRRLQMNELLNWILDLYDGRIKSSQPYTVSRDNPLIVAGDFNICIINNTEDFNTIVTNNGFLNLFDTFNNTPPIPTYDTFENDYCKLQNGDEEYRLVYDYILTSNKFEVIEPQTTIIKKLEKPIAINKYEESYRVVGQVDVYNASDHYPVFTILKIKQ